MEVVSPGSLILISGRPTLGMVRPLTAVLACLCPLPATAQDRSYIEQVLEDQQPCRDLKTSFLGIQFGITRVAALSVDTVSATLKGDELTLEGKAGLTCATSDDALIPGDLSAVLYLDATINILSCEVTRNKTEIGNFGGKFGIIPNGLAVSIDKDLETALVEQCQILDLAGTTDDPAVEPAASVTPDPQ